jgi:hypothetical protein
MLNLLDKLIKAVLDSDWPTGGAAPAKPGFYFTVPDSDWQAKVKGGTPGERLNIYLYEVHENRDLHRAEWDVLVPSPGGSVLSQPPAYLDCHYLISAWSPSEDSETLSPMLDEHELLSEALRILMRNPNVNPAALHITGGGLVFQQAHVYLTVAPPEAPRVLNDFWSTMKLPWRPAIQLIATAPLDLLRDEALGATVVTLVQRYVLMGATGNPDEVVLIGGWVLHSSDDSPVADATVQRVRGVAPNLEVLEEVKTDNRGRFVFTGLRGHTHTFHAIASGLTGPQPRTLDITNSTINDHVFRMS